MIHKHKNVEHLGPTMKESLPGSKEWILHLFRIKGVSSLLPALFFSTGFLVKICRNYIQNILLKSFSTINYKFECVRLSFGHFL